MCFLISRDVAYSSDAFLGCILVLCVSDVEIFGVMQKVVVLSGAGISAESGIPTFRGEGGLWRNFDATVSIPLPDEF